MISTNVFMARMYGLALVTVFLCMCKPSQGQPTRLSRGYRYSSIEESGWLPMVYVEPAFVSEGRWVLEPKTQTRELENDNSEYVSKSVQNRRYDNWLPVVESRESGFDTQAEGSEVEYNVEEALETEKDIDSVATAKFEMFTPDEVEESAYEEFTGDDEVARDERRRYFLHSMMDLLYRMYH